VISTHERPTIVKNIEDVLIEQIVRQLTEHDASHDAPADSAPPQDREIV
jgi:hypothetical protein